MLIEVSKLLSCQLALLVESIQINSLSGQLVQSGGTRDTCVNIVSVTTKSGRLATMKSLIPPIYQACSLLRPVHTSQTMHIMMRNNAHCIRSH